MALNFKQRGFNPGGGLGAPGAPAPVRTNKNPLGAFLKAKPDAPAALPAAIVPDDDASSMPPPPFLPKRKSGPTSHTPTEPLPVSVQSNFTVLSSGLDRPPSRNSSNEARPAAREQREQTRELERDDRDSSVIKTPTRSNWNPAAYDASDRLVSRHNVPFESRARDIYDRYEDSQDSQEQEQDQVEEGDDELDDGPPSSGQKRSFPEIDDGGSDGEGDAPKKARVDSQTPPSEMGDEPEFKHEEWDADNDSKFSPSQKEPVFDDEQVNSDEPTPLPTPASRHHEISPALTTDDESHQDSETRNATTSAPPRVAQAQALLATSNPWDGASRADWEKGGEELVDRFKDLMLRSIKLVATKEARTKAIKSELEAHQATLHERDGKIESTSKNLSGWTTGLFGGT